jgi:hypothetical protein
VAWTAGYLTEWYGAQSPELDATEQSIAASLLWALRGNAVQRALVAWSMGWDAAQDASGTDWLAPYLAELVDDPYDAVRFVAYRSMRTLPDLAELEYNFMGPPAEREAVKQRVLDTWTASRGASTRGGVAELLLNSDDSRQQTAIDRLLRDRDVRPLNLAE